jgi:hypothetical protein
MLLELPVTSSRIWLLLEISIGPPPSEDDEPSLITTLSVSSPSSPEQAVNVNVMAIIMVAANLCRDAMHCVSTVQ